MSSAWLRLQPEDGEGVINFKSATENVEIASLNKHPNHLSKASCRAATGHVC